MPSKGRISTKRRVAIGVGVAIIAATMPLLTLPASATSNPPWEPDPNTHDTGTLVFYNSAGNVVTGGSNLAHLFDYAEGSSADPFHGIKASLEFSQPLPGVATGNWATGLASLSTVFPNAAAPAPLGTTANPVVTLGSTDANLTNFIATQVPPTAAGYVNVYQVRLVTSGPGGTGTLNNDQDYWEADIQVNPTAGTWQEVYPQTSVTATSTVLTANPNPATAGVSDTLTATETPATAGSVDFKDGATDLGSAPVNGSGVATLPATFSTAATHSLTATFTPTDTANFTGSSGALALVVNPAATPTMTSLTVSQTGTVGSDVSLSSTVTPTAAAGTMSWYNNGSSTPLNPNPVTVTGGAATFDLGTGLAAGSYSIVAKFTPTDPTAFEGSQSAPQPFTLQSAACSGGSVCPPWEPDPNTHDTGALVFYNSAGNVVTGGSNLAHLFDYAEASSTDPFHGTKATLEFAQPLPNVLTTNWAVGTGSLSTAFPNASAPAPLGTTANPVATLSSTDANLTNFIATQVPPTAAGYVNVYQVRMVTSGPGGTGTLNNDQDYWEADIQVNPTAGTWQEVYPQTGVSAVPTTTALAANPAGTAQQGASVSLTATVTASDATHPAGPVEFFQDGISLGSVDVSTTGPTAGTATLTTTALLPSAPNGTSLTATFTPTDSSTHGPSTSPSLVYTVNPTASVPTLSGPHQVGAAETCLEGPLGLLDFGVTATFSWQAGGKTIGSGTTLVVPGSAYNQELTCIATVHDGAGPSSSATSNPVKVILGKAPRNTKRPTLSGPHKVGRKETVSHGNWSPSSVTFTYQWLLNGRVIRGATRSTLILTRADKGRTISCRVTAHKAGYANGVATTAGVKVTS